MLWVGAEVLTVRQAGDIANSLNRNGPAAVLPPAPPQRAWPPAPLRRDRASPPGSSVPIPPPRSSAQLLVLVGLVIAYGLLRYLREVANTKMSMTMVFYIREAVYDKLQRVGFGFHDAISTGQLINRALSDLQNVRQFVQTAILATLEIVLVVGGYIVLICTRNPVAGGAVAGAAADLDVVHPALQQAACSRPPRR